MKNYNIHRITNNSICYLCHLQIKYRMWYLVKIHGPIRYFFVTNYQKTFIYKFFLAKKENKHYKEILIPHFVKQSEFYQNKLYEFINDLRDEKKIYDNYRYKEPLIINEILDKYKEFEESIFYRYYCMDSLKIYDL